MDVLSDVLTSVRLTGAIFFDSTFHADFVAESPKASIVAAKVMPASQYVFYFHTLLEGSCFAELTDGSMEPIRLEAGDIIAFPMDDGHALCSTVGLRAAPDLAIYIHPVDRQLPYVLNAGSGAEACRFICGYLGCDIEPYNPFLEPLPRMLHGRGIANQGWLAPLIHYAVSETERQQAGGETVLAKLAELLFVEVIRQHVEGLPAESRGWLSGLRDAHVGRALRLMHGQPAAEWTLEGMARQVGLSPLRICRALQLLRRCLANAVPYALAHATGRAAARSARRQCCAGERRSRLRVEAAFNRAFKKVTGVPPGLWRRRRRSGTSSGTAGPGGPDAQSPMPGSPS